MTFPVADVTVSPLVPFAWALFVGLVFSTIGAAGGILAAVGHITVFGVADANVVKPMSQLLVIVSPLVSVPAYWRRRRLLVAVALLIGSGAVAGSLLGSWSSVRYLGSMRDYRAAFGVLTLVIGLRLWYESTARFRERNARLREAAKAFERSGAAVPIGAPVEMRWRFPRLDVVLSGHAFPCNIIGLVLAGLVVAFVSAALGVGGGFLLVPYLASWVGLPMFVVAGTTCTWACASTGSWPRSRSPASCWVRSRGRGCPGTCASDGSGWRSRSCSPTSASRTRCPAASAAGSACEG